MFALLNVMIGGRLKRKKQMANYFSSKWRIPVGKLTGGGVTGLPPVMIPVYSNTPDQNETKHTSKFGN